MNPGITEEVGKQVGGFMDIMRSQPLSLALVVMNVSAGRLPILFQLAEFDATRGGGRTQIVAWQRGTDKLMASCVSIEVMKLVVDALERDRSLYRQMLPQQRRHRSSRSRKRSRSHRRHEGPPAWRRFAHNVAWFALIIAIVVVVMVLLSR